ncbi:MAG TPA: hypothetical protein VGN90_08510 [Pyrinomonadaceae bacterium]|jgi:hypothetical protein|nr:hypothetical protein [Pyrinomonadaceae bacterium]
MTKNETPFACDMTAIAADQRQAHFTIIRELFQAVVGFRELANGYSFELPNESNVLAKTAEFIALERLCCPFFGFALEIEPEGGAVWLSLTGREGVKPFIIAEIENYLPASIQGIK